jgi:hypothetical protein
MPIPSTNPAHHELRGQGSPATAIPKPANASIPRLLLTRAETLQALRIGETTLFWLGRTGKLKPIRIGARVLFDRAEVEHLATRGCSLTKVEKETAKRDQKIL